jgi:hypothetical protein
MRVANTMPTPAIKENLAFRDEARLLGAKQRA